MHLKVYPTNVNKFNNNKINSYLFDLIRYFGPIMMSTYVQLYMLLCVKCIFPSPIKWTVEGRIYMNLNLKKSFGLGI